MRKEAKSWKVQKNERIEEKRKENLSQKDGDEKRNEKVESAEN